MTDSETAMKYQIKRQGLGVLIARCIAQMDATNATAWTDVAHNTINALFKENADATATYILVKKYAQGGASNFADAVAKVSAQRSTLGAVQNRLEHTIANLDNVVENTTAAESQIRDTDMATEMVKYSNNNILAQAGQAMLAQANQANQGVLSLLG